MILRAIRALAGLRIRAVRDQQHGRRRRRGEARAVFLGNDEHDLRRAAADGGARLILRQRRHGQLDALCFEIARKSGRIARCPIS